MCIPNIIRVFNSLNAELNPICHLLALLGAHHILHVSRIRVKLTSMGWAGHVSRVEEKRTEYRVWWGNWKERNHSDYLGLDVRIILK
jgi:hypothetical protein